jgi:hypothetical protein
MKFAMPCSSTALPWPEFAAPSRPAATTPLKLPVKVSPRILSDEVITLPDEKKAAPEVMRRVVARVEKSMARNARWSF